MSDSSNQLFARLFSESHAALRRYVRRFVGSTETADEIVQEAFLRTYERRQSVETPRAFLFSTARNLAANERRDYRTARTDCVGDLDDLRVASLGESPEDGALASEQSRLLTDAVNRLPPQCRAAFSLRVFHECSYREIADRLGISVKTVEKHIARGLRETHVYLQRRYRDAGTNHG
jgi:RNA polymerase sigma-70 factor (ECF subfamily)